MDNPITRAIEIAGSGPKLGKLLGLRSGRAVYKWQHAWDSGRVDAVPAPRAVQIERELGIPREDIRPDLFVRDDGRLPTDQPSKAAA